MCRLVPLMSNKKVIYTLTVTGSLFLVSLGMKVPDLSRLHHPKPRPRAVIETTVKACQAAVTKANVDVAAFQFPVALDFSTSSFRSSFQQKIHRPAFVALEHNTARAPPVIAA